MSISRFIRCGLGATAIGLALAAQAGAPTGRLPGNLRLNQVQMIGSHNSYRPFPSAETKARVLKLAGEDGWERLEYGHPDIATQLKLGLHEFEIDVSRDPKGGNYAAPYAKNPALFAKMSKPGAKVLHIPVADYVTTCLTFHDCLMQFAAWTKANPKHDPIIIDINIRDFHPYAKDPSIWNTTAVFDEAGLDELDAEIRAVFPRNQLFTPDDLRGNSPTLRQAVTTKGWPLISALRGRVMFMFDGEPVHYPLYSLHHPSLKGRAMFGFYKPGQDEAAILKFEQPAKHVAEMRNYVKQGFLVRTRSDAETQEARAGDQSSLRAGIESGAQIISSDFYDGAPNPHKFNLKVHFDNGRFEQCNMVTAQCRSK